MLCFLGTLPDGTNLEAQLVAGNFAVVAEGRSNSIAQVGQQLAWLGGALRSSRVEFEVATCAPLARLSLSPYPSHLAAAAPSVSESHGPPRSGIIFCQISYRIETTTTEEAKPSGQCWHHMFGNPVIVTGYPISHRTTSGLGLEIPLNMLTILIGSNRLTEFEDKVFIKGFSAMVIATNFAPGVVIWHYFYDKEGEKISYNNHTLEAVDKIDMSQ
jgi:hypothetical protein